MNETSPLLSIVIATKNRVKYCINCIETILKYTNSDFELVIQDNTDNYDLRDYIKLNISNKRLVYNYTPPPFSSIDNFNAALKMVSGEYVCLIGDDDGVCPQIFEVVKWASNNKIESICPKTFCEYIWPNSLGNNADAKLTVPDTTGTITSIDSSKLLINFFDNGALDYLPMGFPKLYHGIVKMECLEIIKERTGNYLGGLSPDIYAAISLACTVKSHVIIDFPLTIAGSCNQSTTIASVKGLHSGVLKNAPHFRDRGDYVWDNLIPPIYSIETIWAETALKALQDMKRTDLRILFNDDLFIVKNILRNTSKFKYFLFETIKHLKSNKTGIFRYLRMIIIFQYLVLKFIFEKVFCTKKVIRKNQVVDNVVDINEATLLSTELLENKAIHFNINA